MGTIDSASLLNTAVPRVVPKARLAKWKAWKFWSSWYGNLYLIVGATSSGLSVLVAANARSNFLADYLKVTIPCVAAVFTFLVSGLGAQAKAAAFETAGRELEKAITAYETNPAVSDIDLGLAEQRGIDILNRMKNP